MHEFMNAIEIPTLLITGLMIIIGYYFGRNMRFFRLPSIIGFMIFGVVLGPSLFNILSQPIQEQLSFVTEIALGFVALSIGLELRFLSLKKLGSGIVNIILFESFTAFFFVFAGVLILTGDLPMALIFGSIAPASAPAGTVAIIQEYKAKGSLTKALYAVVGFDDGLGIIIFGFAAAFARMLLASQTGGGESHLFSSLLMPLKEVALSLLVGGILATVLSLLAARLANQNDIIVLLVGFVFVSIGLCTIFHLSLILTNMVIGMVIVNTQPHFLVQRMHDRLPLLMPLLFILFFTLAGANLHLKALPSLGVLGIVYAALRASGLIFGARLGGITGHVEEKIKKWIGLGILSQAGVAIGLSLIVKHEFAGLGRIVEKTGEKVVTTGDILGSTVITTITATCIFFEIIGPILTKVALKKAGEIASDA
ncbi:cation:proton antiporter [bacterium]|nr:cation:proton antiporter [bacterium]